MVADDTVSRVSSEIGGNVMSTTNGTLCIVGAGPGAADLITLRGAERIAAADVVLCTPVAVDLGWLRSRVKDGAQIVDLGTLSAEQVVDLYRRALRDRGLVVRLHPGDPATWPELRQQRELGTRIGLSVEVVAGIGEVSATAAAIGTSVVEPAHADTVVLADPAAITAHARTGATIAVHAPGARVDELVESLLAGGYTGDTPVVATYKISRPDELVLRTSLRELSTVVKQNRLWRSTLFLVGTAVRPSRNRQAATVKTAHAKTITKPATPPTVPAQQTGEPAADKDKPVAKSAGQKKRRGRTTTAQRANKGR